jgi:hypothetical protein
MTTAAAHGSRPSNQMEAVNVMRGKLRRLGHGARPPAGRPDILHVSRRRRRPSGYRREARGFEVGLPLGSVASKRGVCRSVERLYLLHAGVVPPGSSGRQTVPVLGGTRGHSPRRGYRPHPSRARHLSRSRVLGRPSPCVAAANGTRH